MRATLLLCLAWSCLSLFAAFAGAVEEPAGSLDLRVLEAEGDAQSPPAREMLHRYLLDQARQQFDIRRKAIAAIKTPSDIAARQTTMRAFFVRSLGELPERTPLNHRVVGTLREDGYRIEKVVFESRPSHHVTANLYLPEGNPPFPGILLPCGHSDTGKAYEGYQRACILLAKNGMAVLCYDPIGQGERCQRLDEKGKPVIHGTTEHTMAGIGALLVGRQLASYRVWDGMRALDYLASRPEIDPKRLGCTGNSGGGTLTSYLMALDDRIAVAAPSCYITSLERLFATIGPQDAEQNITGQVAAGMEHADYITMRAPKPTLVTVGTRDFFDIRGSWDTFREVKLLFGRLGHGERVDLFESDEEHGFTRSRRIATARWMKRWLMRQDEAVDEPDFSIASDAELQCTRTGQVLSDFKDKSVFDLNAEYAARLRSLRTAANATLSAAEFRRRVRDRLGLADRRTAPGKLRSVGKISRSDFTVEKLIIEVEPGISLPALDIRASRPGQPGTPLMKVGVDWNRELTTDAAIEDLLRGSGRILLANPRGMGETDPAAGTQRRGSPFGPDVKEAFLSIHLARPMLGQRVADILTVLEALRSDPRSQSGFTLMGVGTAGPIALHAALLDETSLVQGVVLERSLVSWEDVVTKGISRDQLGNVVPGALQVYDLPDLAARLAPRPLRILEPVDAAGRPIALGTLKHAYTGAIEAYRSSNRLELLGDDGEKKPAR